MMSFPSLHVVAPAHRPTVVHREVSLPGDINLHCAHQGPAEGPAVLMLHGYTDSWESFSRVLPLLPASVRVIVPDQRGHGASSRPQHGYAVGDLAADAVALLDALEVPRAMVVGHSMGSFVARRVAGLAPNRVESLVLMGSAPLPLNAVLRELAAAVDGLTEPVDPAFVREFQESTISLPVPADFMARAVSVSQAMPARIWKAALSGLMAHVPGEVPPQCPTLVVGGGRDAVFSREEQAALAASIPGARLELVDEVGHALHWEDPARFVEALTRFAGW